MATITTKVIGISFSDPPPTPAWLSPSANVDDVAAATIPRGAIQAMNARSLFFRVEPNVDSATARGLATNTRTATNARLTQPMSPMSSGETLAERMMNRIPIRKVARVAIRARHARTSLADSMRNPRGSIRPGARLTKTAPITRPVSSPESSRSRSAATTEATTIIRIPVTA